MGRPLSPNQRTPSSGRDPVRSCGPERNLIRPGMTAAYHPIENGLTSTQTMLSPPRASWTGRLHGKDWPRRRAMAGRTSGESE